MKKITDWLSDAKNQRNLIILIAAIVIILMRSCGPSSSEVNTLTQNVSALNDSVRTYRSKNGDLIFKKDALIAENGSLKSLNTDLDKEVKNLKDNPIVVVHTVIKIVHDTIKIPISIGVGVWNADSSAITRDLTWTYEKEYSKGNYQKLSGDFTAKVDTSLNLTASPMHINIDEFGVSMYTGLTENKNGLLEIYANSDYPGFSITNLDGALIDPAKSEILKKYFPPKKWAIGVYTGYGIYIDPSLYRIGSGFQIGIGIQYNILQWNWKRKK